MNCIPKLTSVKVIHYSDTNKAKWDNFVRESPEATMYHLIGWKSILEKTFGFKPYYLMALNAEDGIEGILPMFLMRDIFQRKYLVSNPFANFAGVCGNSEESETQLIKKANEIAIAKNVQYVEFRQLNKRIALESVETGFVTMILQLNKNSEEVWKKLLKAKTRNQVRKAQKSGMELKLSKKGIKEFYKVFSINMRELGTPVFPIQFFQSILNNFPELTDLLLVKKNDVTIAGMLLFKYKNTVSDPWASSLREYNIFSPNNLMYWEAIKYACDNGYDFFDFGRSTVDAGTYNFKKQWGAVPVNLHYQYILNKATKPPSTGPNNKYKKAIDIWKKLPLQLTKVVGPRVVRYLPEL